MSKKRTHKELGINALNGAYNNHSINATEIDNLQLKSSGVVFNTLNFSDPQIIKEILSQTKNQNFLLEKIKVAIFNYLDRETLSKIKIYKDKDGNICLKAPWQLLSNFRELFAHKIESGFYVYANEWAGRITHHKYLHPKMYELYYSRFPTIFDLNNGTQCLEIGSGHKPSPISGHQNTIAGERFIDTTNQDRPIDKKAVKVQNLVQLDGTTTLPFASKTFDFCVISHVVEHLEPIEFVKMVYEALRVSEEAFLEFPNSNYELNFGYEGHLPFIRREKDNRFTFEYKTEEELYNQLLHNADFLTAKNQGIKSSKKMKTYYSTVHPHVNLFYEGIFLKRSYFENDHDEFENLSIEQFILKLNNFIKILVPSSNAILKRQKAMEIKGRIAHVIDTYGSDTVIDIKNILDQVFSKKSKKSKSTKGAESFRLSFSPENRNGNQAPNLNYIVYMSLLDWLKKTDH